MTNERTAADRTIRRACRLMTLGIAVTLAGGCSQADDREADLQGEIRELRESLKATTEEARLEQQRAACRGTVATALMAVHWELLAEGGGEKALVGHLTEAFRSEQVESAFISASRNADDPQLDELETELLKRFAKFPSAKRETGGHPPFAERRSPVDGRYEYYQPSFFKNDCVACHFSAGRPVLSLAVGLSEPEPYREGDLIAIVKVRLKE